MNDIRTAAKQALEALEEYQSKGAPFLACDGAVAALRAALAQQDEQDHNTRAEFERWAASYSTFCLEREDDAALGTAGYKSVEQTMLWHAWQAAKTNAPVGASGGKSGANTRLGLAGADCTHEFAVAATSGISICTKCGLSEMVARKRALRALAQQAEPVQEPVAWYQKRGQEVLTSHPACWGREDEPWTPLYTAPPQRQPETIDEAMRLPRAMAQAYENGYKAGEAHERERCLRLIDDHVRAVDSEDVVRAIKEVQ